MHRIMDIAFYPDFAKLVELFDAHGVSFISVTQAFNTTTSMGRLTLNMLLRERNRRIARGPQPCQRDPQA